MTLPVLGESAEYSASACWVHSSPEGSGGEDHQPKDDRSGTGTSARCLHRELHHRTATRQVS